MSPRICAFGGMVVTMYYGDHAPAHFHVRSGDDEAQIAVGDGVVLGGSLPARQLAAVEAWRARRVDDLLANWKRAAMHKELQDIAPL